MLKQFGEPAWNYQVVRFLNAKGRDVIPRKDRVWSLGPLAARMIAALEATKRPVPEYLQALAFDSAGSSGEKVKSQAAFAMACFWTGEMKLGQIDGVVGTEAGWIDGREVTRVEYDSSVVSLRDLIARAAKAECAERVYLPATASKAEKRKARNARLVVGKLDGSYRRAKDSDQKRQLRGTAASRLRLTPVQATKVNAWIRVDATKAMEWLSPSQRADLNRRGR